MPHRDPEKRREYHRLYRLRTVVSRVEHRRIDDMARSANKRAARFGVVGRLSVYDIRSVLAAGACAYCGSAHQLGVDHVVPLGRGGPNVRENLQPCCLLCNKRKHCRPSPSSWSADFPSCRGCGATDRKHIARGLCNPCYLQWKKGRRITDVLR